MAYSPELTDFRVGDKVWDGVAQKGGTIIDINPSSPYDITFIVDNSIDDSEMGREIECHHSLLAKQF